MANDININIVAEVKKALSEIKKFQKDAVDSFTKLNDTTENFKKSTDGLASTFKKLAVGFVAIQGFQAVSGFFKEATNKAIEFEDALQGVQRVGASFGISAKEIEKVLQELTDDGFIELRNGANALRDLLQSGLSLPQATKLFNTFKEAAVANRSSIGDLGAALEGAAEGFAKNRDMAIKNLSVVFDSKKAIDDYARSVGKSVEQLSQAEIRLAKYNAFLAQGQQFLGASAEATNTLSGSLVNLAEGYDNILEATGRFFTGSTAGISLINNLASVLRGVANIINDAREKFESLTITLAKVNLFFLNITKSIESFLDKITGSDFFSKIGNSAKDYDKTLNQITNSQKVLTEQTAKANREQLEQAEESQKFLDASLKGYEELEKAVIKSTNTVIQNLQAEKAERLKIINDAVGLGVKTEADAAKLKILIEKDFTSKYKQELDKRNKETQAAAEKSLKIFSDLQAGTNRVIDNARNAVSKLAANPTEIFIEIGIIQDDFLRQSELLSDAFKQGSISAEQFAKENDLLAKSLENARVQAALSAVGGVLSNVASGAEGAKKLVTDLAKTGVNALLGEAGKAFGPLIDSFAKGPDVVRQMVKDFVAALPEVINALIEGAVAFIDELVQQLPAILKAIVDAIPKLIEGIGKIIEILLQKLPDIIVTLIEGLIKALPAIFDAIGKAIPKIIVALIDGIVKAIPVIIKGIISAISLIIEKLPELIIAFITGIVDAIPAIIIAIVDSIPILIDALIKATPALISALIKAIPQLIESIIRAIPKIIEAIIRAIPKIITSFIGFIPKIVSSFIGELVKGAGRFVEALIKEIGGGLGDIGKGAGNIISDIGGFFGFAEGGQGFVKSVPSGFSNDSFPAKLTSGELVVDRSTAFALKDFLANQDSAQYSSSSTSEVLLARILNMLEKNQIVEGNITIDYGALSRAILTLNRNNARLTP